ncbi:Uncharacterized protein APZ42_009797, partial [Daphnia magna]
MNVRLAAQILSNSVATGFKYYRERENTKESFEDTEGTEEMVSLINNAFDVMNGQCYKYSIRRSTWRKDRLV